MKVLHSPTTRDPGESRDLSNSCHASSAACAYSGGVVVTFAIAVAFRLKRRKIMMPAPAEK